MTKPLPFKELEEIMAKDITGRWEVKTYPSGTVCVLMREWVGPKSSKYGTGYLAAHIDAFNIDFQDESEIQSERVAKARQIVASRDALPNAIAVMRELAYALDRAAQFKTSDGQAAIMAQALSRFTAFEADVLSKPELKKEQK